MEKCDITINRDQTINVGNYSSVKPSISVTLKDVEIEQLDRVYDKLTTLMSCLLMNETKISLEEFLATGSINQHCQRFLENVEKIDFDKEIELLNKELKNV